ncbi:MAG: VWA domain-containing protein [Bryobacteraceae bacterium]
MHSPKLFIGGLLALSLFAQQEDSPGQVFRATVNVVVAPVTVTDRDGNFVTDLKPSDFRLLDNQKPQDIKVDVSFVPISLVVVVQANWDMEAVLPKIQKIGPLFQGLITGDQGEVAVLCFDHRLQVLQDFTTESDLVSQALKKLKPGSSTSAMIDATNTAIRMLARRPGNRRRIILYIGETRDRGSEGRVRDTLTLAQLNNVLFYPVSVNRLVTTLTAKPMAPRPDPYPAGARPLPPNMAPTPEAARLSVASPANSASFVPVFVEIFKQVKAIFIDNPVEVFTEYTGGREHSFIREKDLERAIHEIGQELHSQYLISYSPNNKMEAGFHEITVEVLGSTGRVRRDLKTRFRAGYWMAAVPD